MRKPFLIIIWTVAAVCAVVGIVIHVFPGRGFTADAGRGTANAGGKYEETGAFSSLDIDCGTATVAVQQGDDYAVEIIAKDPSKAKNMPVWEVKGDTLKVYQKDTNFISLGFFNDTSYYVNVTVPSAEEETIEWIKIDNGTGTICLDGISTDQLNIDTGTGAVKITNSRVRDLKIDSGTGSSTIELVSAAERINIDNGTGSVNLTLPGTESDYDLDLDTGVGSVKVGGEKHRGEYTSRGLGEGKIEIDNGTGSINISFTEESISK